MYQNILVAVDGSPTSDNAFVEAIKLTEQQGSSLHLVHVVDFARAYLKSDTVSQLDDYERALRRAGEEVLDRALATVRSAGLDAKVKLIQIGTINQHASDEVVAEAKRLPADLIVIGTHG